ncbi:MAG: hypothetical protein JWO89_3803, partial [Verrucomicrobiaceae bacterium]|nr:hypothetical protein [Verrucomicrobiaceae bacterium]
LIKKWSAATLVVTTVISSGLYRAVSIALDSSGNLYIADMGSKTIKKWTAATQILSTLVSAGVAEPSGVALDGAGNVYFTDETNNTLRKWTAATQAVTTLVSSGLSLPNALALDSTGNVFISDYGTGKLKKWTVGTGQMANVPNVFSSHGVAVDGTGNLYIANFNGNKIQKWLSATQTVITLAAAIPNYPNNLAVDGSGNVYVNDFQNNQVNKWTAATQVSSTLIGPGILSSAGGLAADGDGNLYIADAGNNAIRKWTAASETLSTLVSTGLNFPTGVAVDGAGNIYIADNSNNAIKKWTAATQTVSTLVSTGLGGPNGVAVDVAGNVYIADTINQAVKVWSAATQTVSTLASSPGVYYPHQIAVDGSGNVYIADSSSTIKVWSAVTRTLTSLLVPGLKAANGMAVDSNRGLYISDVLNNTVTCQPRAFVDTKAKAESGAPGSDSLPLVLPAAENLQAPFGPVSDQSWLVIAGIANGLVNFSFSANYSGSTRTAHISLLGQQVTVTQTSQPAPVPPVITASFASLPGDAVGFTINGSGFDPVAANNIVTLSNGAQGIVTAASTTFLSVVLTKPPTTLLGGLTAVVITDGISSGAPVEVATIFATYALATSALLEGPGTANETVLLNANPADAPWTAVANDSWLHVAAGQDSGAGGRAVGFTLDANPGAIRTGTLTIAGKTLIVTQAGNTYALAQPFASLVQGLSTPGGVAVDGSGNVYIADAGSNSIKLWTAATQVLTTLVSTGLSSPSAVALDGEGNLYIADTGHDAIKVRSAATQKVSTLASSGLSQPYGVAVDASGNVYIADTGNNAVKQWSAAAQSTITLVSAGLASPRGVAVSATGNVYITDTGHNVVKVWDPAYLTVNTVIDTGLSQPSGIAVDVSGNLYIANTYNNSILKWTAATLSTNIVSGSLFLPRGVAVDGAGNVYIADTLRSAVREVVRAFVDAAPVSKSAAAGTAMLPVILPDSASLLPPFAPSSDQSWLTLAGVSDGVVSYYFSANSGLARTAHLNVLGRSVTVKQMSGIGELSMLSTSAGTLAPVFASATGGYTVHVSNATTNVTVYATSFDSNAALREKTI